MAFASRLAIITGGIGGIGSAVGQALRGQGAKLALLYAPFEKDKVDPILEQVYGGGGGDVSDVRAYPCDIAAPESVQEAFDAIAADDAAFPAFLVNSAGYVNLTPLEHTPPDDSLRHYMINLYGPTLTGQAFARLYFRRQQEAAAAAASAAAPVAVPGGRIVNIASQAAHIALHNHGAYCASKAGVMGLTRCQASEWGPRGITANSISPGPVWTALGKKAWANDQVREEYQRAVPTGKFAEPEEVAQTVSFLCQDAALNINGQDLRLDGGYTAR